MWLFVRLTAIAIFMPVLHSKLFVPFLSENISLTLDPWGHWIDLGGQINAFPYGLVMYLVAYPAVMLGFVITKIFSTSSPAPFEYSLILLILIIDYVICRFIGVFGNLKTSLKMFWTFSPILIFISYVHGQLDVIPSLLLFLSVISIRKKQWLAAGVCIGFGIAAKLSIVLVIPFILLFFLTKSKSHKDFTRFAVGAFPGILLLILPVFWSTSYLEMVFGAPEIQESIGLSINLGEVNILLLPIAYLLLFLWYWNLKRISVINLVPFLGAALLVVATLQTTSIGWYYWCLPILASILEILSTRTLILTFIWQILTIIYFATQNNSIVNRFSSSTQVNIDSNYTSLTFTLVASISGFILFKILSESIRMSDPIMIGKKPLSIAIAGDSGVGKDTLTSSIAETFGYSNTQMICGDDYHLRERGDLFWKTTTHLNPKGNDLLRLSKDFQLALNRQKFFARKYDHTHGRFTLPDFSFSQDLIVLNGLHSLMLSTSYRADLRVYLSMDEELRVALKTKRDSQSRDQSLEEIGALIEKRKIDYEKFILPQSEVAHLKIHITRTEGASGNFSAQIDFSSPTLLEEIFMVTSSVRPQSVALDNNGGDRKVLLIDDDFTQDDVELAFRRLIPEHSTILNDDAKFDGGIIGYIGMICLVSAIHNRKMAHD